MSQYTAADYVTRALRILGVLASGEIPDASEFDDSIVVVNQMLDSWSIERLSVYGTTETVVTWPAGEDTQTIGVGGDLSVTPNPVQIDPSTYFVVSGISYNLTMVNQDQYNSIALKSSASTLPQVMFSNKVDLGEGQVRAYLYPVPSQDIELHVVSVIQFPQIGIISDQLILPAGYARAFAYNLAVELAPEFGIEASRTVKAIARASKASLKRINDPDDVMGLPDALVSSNRNGYNIYAGY